MMKRLSSSDSVCGLISLSPNTSTDDPNPRRYGREFQSMLEGYDEEEEEETIITEERRQTGLAEKKRRLSINQVKALEKNFEIENKLEPERKVKLAKELCLQPRQVAVWFQNRRARWKTKQLEKDYGLLKSQFDSLRHNFDSLRRDNDSLLHEISKLKSKLNGGEEEEEEEEEDNNAVETMESDISVKEEETLLPDKITELPSSPPQLLEHSDGFNYRSFTDLRDLLPLKATASSFFAAAGSSDSSDSSAVLNEESSSNVTVAPATVPGGNFYQSVKMEQTEEDHDGFLNGEEACGFFSDEQPPSLHWYTAVDHWT